MRSKSHFQLQKVAAAKEQYIFRVALHGISPMIIMHAKCLAFGAKRVASYHLISVQVPIVTEPSKPLTPLYIVHLRF